MADLALNALIDRVRAACADKTALNLIGGNTKAFYGEAPRGAALDLRPLAGISSYEPSELVVTVRAGTPLAELEAALAERGQCLPFEPPRFAPGSTVGGMVAAGLAGPARAAVGGVRDYVLGVICEVSLKVLPVPVASTTLRFERDEAAAIKQLNTWGGQPLPINASAWWDGMLVLRLSGAAAAVQSATQKLRGEVVDPALAAGFWAGVRDQSDEFFAKAQTAVAAGATLWRLSVAATTPPMALPGEQLVEWGGAQRWVVTTAAAAVVREAAARAGGHATAFRGLKANGALAPLSAPLARIHREMKTAFDPDRIFNPGRLYPGL